MNLISNIFVITAPSGTGKTTINRKLVSDLNKLCFSVSHTTRKKREGEENGVHYWFITKEDFQNLVKQEKMLEWAKVFGSYYGTGYSELKRAHEEKKSLLLEIDVQGWQSVKNKVDGLCSIFLLPPSMKELWNRLQKRGTETQGIIKKRFTTAVEEIKIGLEFDHYIINDNLESTYQLTKDFLLGKTVLPLSTENGRKHCKKLLEEFRSFNP